MKAGTPQRQSRQVVLPGRPHPYLHRRRNSWMRQRHPREVYYRAKAQVVNTGFSGVVGWNFRWLVLSFCFVLDLFTLFYVSECFCLSVCVCTVCMPGAFGSQKRDLDFLKLESQMVVIHHVGARNRARGPCSGNKCSSAFDSQFYGDFFFLRIF